MQHKPYVSTVVDNAFKSKLSSVDFPSTTKDGTAKPTNVIVFIVGGATYEEAADLSVTYNSDKDVVILGGSTVQNSKSFIADIMSISQLGGQPVMHAFEVENPKQK